MRPQQVAHFLREVEACQTRLALRNLERRIRFCYGNEQNEAALARLGAAITSRRRALGGRDRD
jgi:hypothetical protein